MRFFIRIKAELKGNVMTAADDEKYLKELKEKQKLMAKRNVKKMIVETKKMADETKAIAADKKEIEKLG